MLAPLPTYHAIVAASNPYAYSATVQQLKEQCEHLRRSAPGMRVTFDDGHCSHSQRALPLLVEHRISGIFFVVAGWIGTRGDSLRWSDLREISRHGHEVQSHSLTHRFLTKCSNAELHSETRTSKEVLEQGLGAPVEAISIPFGRYNDRVVTACREAGYRRIYTSDILAPVVAGVEMKGRFMVRNTTSLHDFVRILHAGPAQLAAMQGRENRKRLLRQMMGERMYHALWGVFSSRDALVRANSEHEASSLRR